MVYSILSEGANFMEKFSLSIHTDIDTPTNTDTFLKILPIPIQIWPILINPIHVVYLYIILVLQ